MTTTLLRDYLTIAVRTAFVLLLTAVSVNTMAQVTADDTRHHHRDDSTDVFFRHLDVSEVTVTGVTGQTKMRKATAPISVIRPQELRATTALNIVDAIARQPGISQLTTGGSIAKPIIRGLGYNRVVVMSDGIRQEGQQWGDEHGLEVDGNGVGSVEVMKGPASLMYGSDAMAGVIILHPQTLPAEGEVRGAVMTEYQSNNGQLHYSLAAAGNQKGLVWDARYTDKRAHAYHNRYDGYVPGSQFGERAGRLRIGLQRRWGHSWLTWNCYHLTPSIVEGERDSLTGELEWNTMSHKTYRKTLPFQQVKHYKVVWDNVLNIGDGMLKAIVGYQQNRRQEYEESADDYELYFKMHTLTYDLRYVSGEYDGWRLSAGTAGMYQTSGNEGEEYLIPAYRLADIGLYATATKTLTDRWTLNGGLRYDHRRTHGDALKDPEGGNAVTGSWRFTDFTRHFNGLTGSIGAVWNVNRQVNLRLNVARGFRTPNMSEMASNGVHEGSLRYEIGQHQLKAEYSLQADLGVDFSSDYVSAQVALFANTIDNYIFTHRLPTTVEEGLLTYAYTQGDARLVGFEAGVDMHPVHSLHFKNTFAYVDARLLHQGDNTKYLPFTPAPRWTAELKWELMHHRHSTVAHRHGIQHRQKTVTLDNLYVAASADTYLRQSHVYRADETETPTPAYTLLGMAAGTDLVIAGKKWAELYLTADNLLDKAYQSHLSRLKYADVNVLTGRQGIYNPGRNITMKIVVPIRF